MFDGTAALKLIRPVLESHHLPSVRSRNLTQVAANHILWITQDCAKKVVLVVLVARPKGTGTVFRPVVSSRENLVRDEIEAHKELVVIDPVMDLKRQQQFYWHGNEHPCLGYDRGGRNETATSHLVRQRCFQFDVVVQGSGRFNNFGVMTNAVDLPSGRPLSSGISPSFWTGTD